MCKVYMFYQVLKSFIWKNVYANVNSMFDVSGENQEADNNSNKQKASLVDVFEKMEFTRICDNIIDYALFHGELITFCAWKKKEEEYRKQIGFEDLFTSIDAQRALLSGHFHYITTRSIYDNPYVYAVNPANLVFDIAQKDNWDDCPKIYKSWKTAEDIINNKYYKVSDECAEYLRNATSHGTSTDNIQSDDKLINNDEYVNGSTIEVLEHWGTLTLSDGTTLKNWHVVVVGRKYVVRFEKNNRIVNPFTYGVWIEDCNTKRGVSPLYCTLSLAKLQETMMNKTIDLQSLNENPPVYAPEGYFDEDEIKLYPGRVIELSDDLMSQKIQQMTFNDSVFLNDITFLSDLMAEVSGIFPNMAGADESKSKTATEISTKTQGQLTRLSMLIDIINQDLVVPVVKNVAKLLADFKQGDEQILVPNGDEKDIITIDDTIRKGEYKYTYSDRTATTERSNKADLVVQACQQFAQFMPLKVPELFTWYMEQKGVENSERFIQQNQQIPDEIQQELLQDDRIAELCRLYEQGKEQDKTKGNQQQKSVIPDASIPQAQPME